MKTYNVTMNKNSNAKLFATCSSILIMKPVGVIHIVPRILESLTSLIASTHKGGGEGSSQMRKIAYKGEWGSNFGEFCAYVPCGWPHILKEKSQLKRMFS